MGLVPVQVFLFVRVLVMSFLSGLSFLRLGGSKKETHMFPRDTGTPTDLVLKNIKDDVSKMVVMIVLITPRLGPMNTHLWL